MMLTTGEFILLEMDFKLVALATFMKALPIKYSHLQKTHDIVGKASEFEALKVFASAHNLNPELTVVLKHKESV